MRILKVIVISLLVFSCTNNNDDYDIVFSNPLSDYLFNRTIETGAVIACAASEENTNKVLVYYYPKYGARDFRFYETPNALIDKNDFSKYEQIQLLSESFFNDYMGKFTCTMSSERWVIITYELNGEIKMSNPIRTKQIEKPTVWNDEVNIDQEQVLMPKFTWQENAVGDNAIYFQVVSNANNDLISGTYTLESNFTFYDLSNVVLNISEGAPELESLNNYNFTLMDVSIDNWVNIVTQKAFVTQ